MNMLAPVNLDIARLLKQKGFSEPCDDYWEEGLRSSTPDEWKLNYYQEAATDFIKAPTIIQTVMWLYKTHNIWISVNKIQQKDTFTWEMVQSNEEKWYSIDWSGDEINSPEVAYVEAILYILTNVI